MCIRTLAVRITGGAIRILNTNRLITTKLIIILFLIPTIIIKINVAIVHFILLTIRIIIGGKGIHMAILIWILLKMTLLIKRNFRAILIVNIAVNISRINIIFYITFIRIISDLLLLYLLLTLHL